MAPPVDDLEAALKAFEEIYVPEEDWLYHEYKTLDGDIVRVRLLGAPAELFLPRPYPYSLTSALGIREGELVEAVHRDAGNPGEHGTQAGTQGEVEGRGEEVPEDQGPR